MKWSIVGFAADNCFISEHIPPRGGRELIAKSSPTIYIYLQGIQKATEGVPERTWLRTHRSHQISDAWGDYFFLYEYISRQPRNGKKGEREINIDRVFPFLCSNSGRRFTVMLSHIRLSLPFYFRFYFASHGQTGRVFATVASNINRIPGERSCIFLLTFVYMGVILWFMGVARRKEFYGRGSRVTRDLIEKRSGKCPSLWDVGDSISKYWARLNF